MPARQVFNNNNSWGTANTATGSAAAGPLSTINAPNVIAVPTPGTVVIRLNGRVETDLTAVYTDLDHRNVTFVPGTGPSATLSPTGAITLVPGVPGHNVTTSYKVSPLGIGSYFRLYPGFDGLAANGLRYGATVEIRENFPGGTGATPGVAGTAGTAASPSTVSALQNLYRPPRLHLSGRR